MEKALIHYFSGTGNSFLVAKQLGRELERHGYDVVFHSVELGTYDHDHAVSLHIFLFPIYATAVPHIMRRYFNNLPDGSNVKAAVLSTNGRISTSFRDGYQGWALHEARLLLRLKNYQVFFSDTLDYPHNITIAIPPRKDKNNQKIIAPNAGKIASDAEKIARGQKSHRSMFYPNMIWSIPFGLLYSFFGRRFIGKLFAADSACNSCQLCAKQCPVKAIDASHSQIRWRWNCEGCLRCINSCPRQAIQTSFLRLVAFVAAASIDSHFFIQSRIPDWIIQRMGNAGWTIFSALADVVFFLIVFMLLDWIIYRLSYIPVFKKAAGWGFTKYYGRYRADRFDKTNAVNGK